MRQILSILGFFASLVLAFALCGVLADLIFNNIPFITNAVRGFIESMLATVLSDDLSTKEAVVYALAQSKIPAFLHELILNVLVSSGFELQIIDVLTKWALVVICFISILVVSYIVFFLLKKFIKFITQLPIIKTVDKTLGMILCALKALVSLIMICTILSLFIDVNYYLVPDGNVFCVFTKLMEFIINLPFVSYLFG